VQDWIVGLLAIAVGALFCFRGFMTMRVVIPIWGAFTGFFVGAGLVSSFTDDGFLGSTLAWLVGIAVAVVFGAIAYLYYEISVMIAMGAIGFSIGTTVMVAVGVSWSWLIVLVGVVFGGLLAFAAIVADLPTVLLVVLTALGGASIIVFGVMLLAGVIDTADVESVATTKELEDDWWWYGLYVVLAIVGGVAQFRAVDRLSATMRETWADAGGREFRAG
jgi:hypothetical protein